MYIAVFGATSAIAQATARLYAALGASFFLVGRHEEKLQQVASDLKARGATSVICQVSDTSLIETHEALLQAMIGNGGAPDIALLAWGTLPDQKAMEQSVPDTLREFTINGTSVIALCAALAGVLEKAGKGTLAVITSVAGDRGRRSNYTYGAAKAAVSTFVAGLRARLQASGVHVLTIKPGFVDTPMTASFKKGALWATPETVASGIQQAITKKRNVVYLPWFWLGIMTVIKMVPEAVSKRLKY
jgi:decaprenylphospho-beta-D-erythro-pentofuranosid-2-ulose 2-reductase